MISADRRQELLGRLAALPPERRAAMRRSLGSSRPEGRVWPLSFGQERLWFLSRFDPTDTSYHVPWTVRLRGPADGERWKRRWAASSNGTRCCAPGS
ncbi:hypothetical protein [Nonomuraea recticatena]|uniref:hypothetical protein n=1 Tax=Nonomuraea recticatena TaxID=46178 RepID=UPI00361A49FB